MTLEGAQAGLSWSTILNKRQNYRTGVPRDSIRVRVARFDERDVESLLQDAGIVRHRGKIESTINNARKVLEIQAEAGSFAEYVWDFVDGTPIVNRWKTSVGAALGVARVPRDEPRHAAARVPLRRTDDLLRFHAGRWSGERPRALLLPISRDRGVGAVSGTEVREVRFQASSSAGDTSAILLLPAAAKALFVLGHGAGAGMRHPFMETLADLMAARQLATFRYQFAYMERGGRRPDPQPILLATVRSALAAAVAEEPGLPTCSQAASRWVGG